MAVYRRSYQRYEGPLTPEQWRFDVLRRYALKNIFEYRIHTALFALSFIPPLVALVLIYFINNLDGLATLNIPRDALQFVSVDGTFFLTVLQFQTFSSFVLVALLGPGLVSPDLANNAMPLYLSRPLTRAEYVAGKLSVLLTITSLVTWVPVLLLILVHSSLSELSWFWSNLRIVVGVVIGSLVWIVTISLIALAISAWVRWRPVAIGSLFAIFFVSAGFGEAANELLMTKWGTVLNITADMSMVWRWLLLEETSYRSFGRGNIPSWVGLIAMLGICGASLFMLHKRVRAAQEVR
jgi:ABC-2 type transport system permease protein